MVQRVNFAVHLYANHAVLVVTRRDAGPSSARILSTRDLPGLKVGASPNECFMAVIEALSPTHEE